MAVFCVGADDEDVDDDNDYHWQCDHGLANNARTNLANQGEQYQHFVVVVAGCVCLLTTAGWFVRACHLPSHNIRACLPAQKQNSAGGDDARQSRGAAVLLITTLFLSFLL